MRNPKNMPSHWPDTVKDDLRYLISTVPLDDRAYTAVFVVQGTKRYFACPIAGFWETKIENPL
jgi:hypothetical protein